MKVIDNILDNYYTEKLINEILYEIKIKFNLDTKVEYKQIKILKRKQYTLVHIYAKPRHYKTYTSIFKFLKEDSFNKLINLKSSEKSYITEKIKRIDKDNLWNKKED